MKRTRARHHGIALIISCALALGGVSCEPSPPGPARPPQGAGRQQPAGTRKMAALLEAYRQDRARSAAAFDAARSRAQASRAPDPWEVNRPESIPALREAVSRAKLLGDHIRLRLDLEQELVWSGKNEEALEVCRELESITADARDRIPPADLAGLRLRILAERVAVDLRMAEAENCVAHHNADSCIFPIEEGGVHGSPGAMRAAIEALTSLLEAAPEDLSARWLLNLAYMTVGEHPDRVPPRWLIPASAFASDRKIARFRDGAAERGADVFSLAGGCVLEDLDGDGDLDLVVSGWSLDEQLVLLRNRGDGRFEDRTKEAGLIGEVGGLNLSHADYDNDGDADILVLRGAWQGDRGAIPPSLLRGNGDGTFDDVTEEAGLLALHPGQVGAWGDYDNDGWLDLFLGHEDSGSGEHPSLLYHNEGGATFAERGAESGVGRLGFVKGAAWGDYDNDGRLDLYVSRRGAPNLLLHNEGPASAAAGAPRGPWRFRDVGALAGVTEPLLSFATWFFDYDNDGWLDLFVAGYDTRPVGDAAAIALGLPHGGEVPRLYRNQGDGTFVNVTHEAGLDRVLLVMGANFGDLDNDGWLDLYLGTGAPDLRSLVPNRMFRNDAGRRFEDVTTSGGFGHLQKGHGVAFGDVDGDGDQDIYAVLGGWYSTDRYRNCLFENPGDGHHWLRLRLRGTRSNRAGLGARLRLAFLEDGRRREIHDVVGTGGSFGSSSYVRHLGLARATRVEELEITWPVTGRTQLLRDVAADQTLEVVEEP